MLTTVSRQDEGLVFDGQTRLSTLSTNSTYYYYYSPLRPSESSTTRLIK